MGFFKDLEIDVLNMYEDQVPIDAIAKNLNLSIEEVERILNLQDCDYDSEVVTYDDLTFEPQEG